MSKYMLKTESPVTKEGEKTFITSIHHSSFTGEEEQDDFLKVTPWRGDGVGI